MRLTSAAQYWRNKLKHKKGIDFPARLCEAMADITDEFSFAYLKEAFVATLLELARKHGDDGEGGDGDEEDEEDEDENEDDDEDEDDPLDKYEFWRAFKAQVKMLRSDMGSEDKSREKSREKSRDKSRADSQVGQQAGGYEGIPGGRDEMVALLQNMRLPGGPQPAGKAASTQDGDGFGLGWERWMSDGSPVGSFAPLAGHARRTTGR